MTGYMQTLRRAAQLAVAACATLLLLAIPPHLQATPAVADVIAFSFTPTLVDTGARQGTVTLTMRLNTTATICGYGQYSPSQVNFYSPSHGDTASAIFTPANLKPGTADTYVSNMTLRQNSEQGTWTLYYVALAFPPCNGTYTTLFLNDMSTRGFPTTFQVKNSNILFLPFVSRPR